jgi:hypothetical protein
MNPLGGFDPTTESTFREMDRMNSLTDHMERIDRMINPLKHIPSENAFEKMAADLTSDMERVDRLLNPLKYKAAELNPLEAVAERLDPCATMAESLFDRIANSEVLVTRPDFFTDMQFPQSRTLAKLQQMSDDEIQAFLDDNPSLISVQLALHELQKRHLNKVTRPHWSVSWTFWLVVGSFITSIATLILALR